MEIFIKEDMDYQESKTILNLVFVINAIFVLFFDQLTKYIIIKNVALNESIEVIPNILMITHIKNTGAAFGLFQNNINIFIVISVIAIVLIIILKIKFNINSYFYHFSLGFILGGALGNLVDRFLFGEVTDFINFIYYPVFNVADSFIVIGFGILVIIIFKQFSKKGKIR